MIDPTKEEYSVWLEKALRSLLEQRPKKIAFVAIDEDGNYFTTYYECAPIDLYAMSGALHSEGIWLEFKANGPVIREIMEDEDG